jgi:hypothetical protein
MMKKNIFFTMIFALISMALVSCEDKETEGLSRFTYYPLLEIEGDGYMVIDKGSNFQDPGFTATLNGEDVSDQVTVNSNLDTSKSGIYTIVYSIKNADGIAANAHRTVVVLDPNSAVEGFYLNSADSYRLRQGAQVAYGAPYEVLIIDRGDGSYSVDDLLGGWYCQRAGYGTNYAMAAIVTIAADGTLSAIRTSVPGWGDGADSVEGTFDVATGTLSMKVVYAGMDFVQTWVKE